MLDQHQSHVCMHRLIMIKAWASVHIPTEFYLLALSVRHQQWSSVGVRCNSCLFSFVLFCRLFNSQSVCNILVVSSSATKIINAGTISGNIFLIFCETLDLDFAYFSWIIVKELTSLCSDFILFCLKTVTTWILLLTSKCRWDLLYILL